jgi:putative oxidoreductase
LNTHENKVPTLGDVHPAALGKGVRIADWIIRILLALAFLAAGGAKLAGASPMVAIFEQVGVGQWFRLVTGALEVVGAVLVLIPRTSQWGALLLAAIMVGAVFTHLAVIGGSPAPALLLLALSATTLWLRRHQLLAAFGARP